MQFPRLTIAALPCLLCLCLPSAAGDELHLKEGKVIYGRLESDAGRSYKFLEAGKKKAKTFTKAKVGRVVLTWSLPDFVYTDPKWSREMVDARQKQSFEPGWGEVEVFRSKHYIVFTNSSAGKRYLETMEDIYDRFKKTFPFDEPTGASLMPVFLFKTPDHYYRFYANIARVSIEAAKKSKGHAWRDYYATYYDSPKDPTHYHEGAHQLVANRLGIRGGGSWFQEGLAVYFEGSIFPGEDPSKGMKSEVRQRRHTTFPEMFSLRSLLHSSEGGSLARRRYQQAGAMMKFFAEGPYQDQFVGFLDAARNGEAWDAAFQRLYQASTSDVEDAFIKFYSK